MAFGDSYKTGTVAVTAGSVNVVGAGTLWSAVLMSGDLLCVGGYVVPIDTITDDTHVVLKTPWPAGSTLSAASYVVEQVSIKRLAWGPAADNIRATLTALAAMTIIFYVTGTVPDPSLGEEGQHALKTNAGAWKQWIKTGGVWVDIGTPVGTVWRGLWLSTTAYTANDGVYDNGSSYIARSSNTNQRPSSSPTYWDLSAAQGLPGNDGGAIVIPYTLGNSTADADPGNGLLRFGPAATQRQATVLRLDLLDSRGIAWGPVLDDIGAGTSTVKFKIRLYKSLDQTAFILFNATAVATPSGYRNVTVAAVNYSADSPFTAGDTLALAITQSGDKGTTGDTGATGTGYLATSTTSASIATGSLALSTQAGLAYTVGARARAASNATPSKWAEGIVTGYSGTTLTILVDKINGSGTVNDWNINVAGQFANDGAAGVSGTSAFSRARVATTINAALATDLQSGSVVDGVTLATNDIVLVDAQTTAGQNGVYVVQASGTALRHTDFATYDAHPGAYFGIMEGTVNGGTQWRCTSVRGGTLGTTAIVMVKQVSMSGANNLSELTNKPLARTTLGLGDLATMNSSDLADPVAMAMIFGG